LEGEKYNFCTEEKAGFKERRGADHRHYRKGLQDADPGNGTFREYVGPFSAERDFKRGRS